MALGPNLSIGSRLSRYRPAAQAQNGDFGGSDPYGGGYPLNPYMGGGGGGGADYPVGTFDPYGEAYGSAPYNPGMWQGAPPQMGQQTAFPYYSGNDLAQQYQNNRNIEQGYGDLYGSLFGGNMNARAWQEQAAGQTAAGLYGGLMRTPGYSDQEMQNMLGGEGYGGAYGSMNNFDYGSNYLNGDEQQGIRGNPNGPGQSFDPSILNDVNSTGYGMGEGALGGMRAGMNGAYDRMYGDMNAAIDPNNLRQSRAYQGATNNIMNYTGSAMEGARSGIQGSIGNVQGAASGMMGDARNSALQMDPRFADAMHGAAYNPALGMNQEYATGMRSAAYDPRLAITGEYARQAGMTDEEVNSAATMGGEAVGAQYRSAIQDLDRNAAASGNASPMALAAMRSQYMDQNAAQNADAIVQARLGARAQQRQAATGVEQTRLGAQQYQTGAEMGAEQSIEGTRLGAEQFKTQAQMDAERAVEGTRLGAQQFQTQAELEAGRAGMQAGEYEGSAYGQMGNMALQQGQFAQGTMNDQEQMRLAAEQGLSGMRLGAASQIGQMGQQNAMAAGQMGQQNAQLWQQQMQQAGMYNQSSQYGAALTAEQAAAQRAAYLGENRQNVNFSNQGNQFNRNFQVQGQLSNIYNQQAQQRMSGQSALRNYYTGQQQYQGGMYNQNAANLLTNRAQTQQGRQGASQGSAAWELGNRQNPSLGGQFASGLIRGVTNGIFGAMAGA